jgi:AcrR family transcriptional regulator
MEQQGVASIGWRDLARRAGVSHNAPSRHFAGREALLAALAEEGFAMLGASLRGAKGRELGEAYVRFALAHPQRFRLMFGGQLSFERHPGLRRQAAGACEALQRAFADLGPDAGRAAAAAWSLVHGLSHLLLDGHFAQASRDAGGPEPFARSVIGAMRFAAAAQRSA